MSQESVAIVKGFVDAINRRDWPAARKSQTPDYEYDQSRSDGPQHDVYKREQMQSFLDDISGAWESVRYEAHDYVPAGGQVVVPFTSHVRGRDGIELQARAAWVFTIRDGAVARQCYYPSRQDALEAVGLSEQYAHADS
jgi:ketosteroid isomerase-like protein